MWRKMELRVMYEGIVAKLNFHYPFLVGYNLRTKNVLEVFSFYKQIYYLLSCSVVPDSLWPTDSSLPSSLPMEFSRQEYWSRLPFPSPNIFLPQGSNLGLLHLLYWQADSLLLCHLVSNNIIIIFWNYFMYFMQENSYVDIITK